MTTPDPRKEIVTHLPALRAFAISLVSDRTLADDILHDTLVKAWTNFDRYKTGTNLRAWLFTILRNTYYSDRRRAKFEQANDGFLLQDARAVKPDHDGKLQMTAFMKALNTLPVEQREALLLVGVSGFTYDEAADMCGVAIGTIKSRINRARARLSDMLDFDPDSPHEMTDMVTQGIVNSKT